jgi:ATP/maltotriose-dependent transcriptional regulator MalT
LAVEPLGAGDSERLLASLLGGAPVAELAASVGERSDGIPFYIEEIAASLTEGGWLRQTERGIELDPAAAVPLPETVRDAVLQRVDRLPDGVRRALATLAVAGGSVETGLVAALVPDPQTLDRLSESGLLVEDADALSFRHSLIKDAIYESIPWGRRREIHRVVADTLVHRHAPPTSVAAHRLAAGEPEPARQCLVAAASAFRRACAFRDAALALNRALELWPDGVDVAGRLDALELLAECAERTGEGVEALRALQEAADLLEQGSDRCRFADVQRRTAALLELQGAWERALAMRQVAAAAFAAAGEPGEAAAERLACAARLRSAGSFRAALDLIQVGREEAESAGREGLVLRLDALEGNVRARSGDVENGAALVRGALGRALAAGESAAAADAYQRLADSLEHAGDYGGARGTYTEAASFCRSNDAAALGDVCLACLAMVLRQTGEWGRAVEVSRQVIASPTSTAHALAVCHGVWGSILLHRGEPRRARAELHNANVVARRIGLAAMDMDTEASLARLAAGEGRAEESVERCRRVLKRWHATDGERHYCLPALRWITTLAAERGARDLLDAATDALVSLAAQPNAEVQAAACHALGETALVDGDPALAAARFDEALMALGDLDLPFERAEVQARAGRAHAAAGNTPAAVRHFRSAYRAARRLEARPFATRIAEEVAALGESVERRLGRLAAAGLGRQGLSPRELEVTRLVAGGLTSREIAGTLNLSPRTVEMHVHRILVKLDCRTRVDVARQVAAWDLSPGG